MNKKIRIKEYFDQNVKEYSVYDNLRSIPSVYDGLKLTQRKALWAMLKRGENAELIRVSQAASYMASVLPYHHGEASAISVIENLAQDFAGANNINYLEPSGQFGSRLSPECAAPRYTKTRLHKENYRSVFVKDDELILKMTEEDGEIGEPEILIPILPNILINGSSGMGTGFSCQVMMYNPDDLKKAIKDILEKDVTDVSLIPWYRGFQGSVEKGEHRNQWIIKGKFERVNSTTIKVTELPIGMYQDRYKEYLAKLIDEQFIKDYDDNSTATNFEFILTCPRSTTALSDEELMQKLKLISKDTENFTLWIEEGKLKVFEDAYDVLRYFIDWRLRKYEERRLKLIEVKESDLSLLEEKKRFIEYYIAHSQEFAKKNKKEIYLNLEAQGFRYIEELMNLKIYNLTGEEIVKLQDRIDATKKEISELKATDNKKMWIKEILLFETK